MLKTVVQPRKIWIIRRFFYVLVLLRVIQKAELYSFQRTTLVQNKSAVVGDNLKVRLL